LFVCSYFIDVHREVVSNSSTTTFRRALIADKQITARGRDGRQGNKEKETINRDTEFCGSPIGNAGMPILFDSARARQAVEQIAAGKVPTKAGVQAMLAGFTGNDEWYTPAKWIERARVTMGSIDVDPASCEYAQRAVRATVYYDSQSDGLVQPWNGNVWLNPPYSRGLMHKFIDKLRLEFKSGRTKEAVVLTGSRTDTRWFHDLAPISSAIAMTRGRISFYNEQGVGRSPANGSTFFYLGPNVESFIQAFSGTCLCLRYIETAKAAPFLSERSIVTTFEPGALL
jgi:hypothetical protein